ncbi:MULTISPECIES: helix-turn-helix domain-containing protein [Mycobacteriales]|uniref:helix-turn-helix domain-containing protein n=1 Tax=Mycobacteriales TaxID=85007 RepID=UPI000B8D9A8B|nr:MULTISPECIES: helix-turn-helix domain-containing protein [Mycobacteriales]ASR05572.1 Transcriptional activator NphR [Gordonia rubripertincta]
MSLTLTETNSAKPHLAQVAPVIDSAISGDLHDFVTHHVGSIGFGEIQGSPSTLIHGQRTTQCSGMIELALQISGRCFISQDGRVASLVPGEFAIVDTRNPYQVSFDTRFTCLVIAVAPELLPVKPCALNAMTARRVPGHDGIGRLAAQFLRNIAHQAHHQDLRNNHELASAVVNIVTAALEQQLRGDDGHSGTESHRPALLPRVKAYIEARLDDPELNPAEVARANHISLRYLQRLFETEGTTVSDWVRRRRLEHCRAELADRKNDAISIATLAARWGFLDSSYFSRVFKSTFGLTPREFRLSPTRGDEPT